MTTASAGEMSAITSAVVDPPPDTVATILVPAADPTYAEVIYNGNPLTRVLVQQGGGISPAGDDLVSDAGSWDELGEGSPQLPCVYGLPLGVVADLSATMQECG